MESDSRFCVPQLPYYPFSNALEPHIDAVTQNLHTTKHEATCVCTLNAAVAPNPDLAALGAAGLCRAVGTGGVSKLGAAVAEIRDGVLGHGGPARR